MRKGLIYILIVAIVATGVIYYYNSSSKQEVADQDQVEDIDNNDTDVNTNKSEDIEDNEGEESTKSVVERDYSIEPGKKLPDFTLENLAGEQVSLSDYEGKIVLINFWATWCKWCDIEMPDLQKINEENEDLVVVAVNVDEPISKVQKYIDDGGYTFDVLLDKEGKISRNYLVSGLPNSYFADKDGIFIGRVQGAVNYEQLNEVLEDIRNEQ